MVGLSEAEQLAHHMESYLRALRQGEARLGDEGVEALMAGVLMLEQVIAARRKEEAPPGIDAAVARLQAMLGESASGESSRPGPAGAGSEGDTPGRGRTGKARTWRFEFVP